MGLRMRSGLGIAEVLEEPGREPAWSRGCHGRAIVSWFDRPDGGRRQAREAAGTVSSRS
jgi:hypothetical protein